MPGEQRTPPALVVGGTDRIVVEELLIRLPGVSEQVAREVSREVALRIGAGLREAMPTASLGAVEVRVAARSGATRDELVVAVATAVLQAVLR
jgi:hypothetical protein